MLEMISDRIGDSIPTACQDWANTKAAYRFFSSKRFSEVEILGGHFQATRLRASGVGGTLLVLHDTTEFSYERGNDFALGLLRKAAQGVHPDGKIRHHTARGILMHSSLVVTPDGLPLGMAAIKFWSRKKFKGCNALKRKINPTRVPIEQKESYRWLANVRESTALIERAQDCVHIGDRESDIYELFCSAEEIGTRFLVRTCVDRLAKDGNCTVGDVMDESPWKGVHRVEGRTKAGECYEAVLQIRFEEVLVRPPIGKEKKYPELRLTVIHAVEQSVPKGREKIQWKLLTNLPVDSLEMAIEKLEWYAMRWKIETFHKILKSGCKTEASKLRTSERLTKLISLCCVISWRVFWMTMVGRENTAGPASAVFTKVEMKLLDLVVKKKAGSCERSPAGLAAYTVKLAQLGGYLARAGDPPPGNMVIWKGLSRLNDIQLGFDLASELMGN